MLRGKVVIIPDEEQIIDGDVEENILEDEYHMKVYRKFFEDNDLDYVFDDEESQFAALTTADLGHFNYKTEEDLSIITFYLPKIITDGQLEYFKNHKDEYSNYWTVGAYIFRKVGNTIYTDELYGLDEIEKEMTKRNEKGKENRHVR